MEDFLLLSNLYSQVNKALHHHGHDYDSSQLTFLVNQIKRCFISLSTKTMDKEFNESCKSIADALASNEVPATASDIERIWQENDISSVMKKGSMIFTSFGEVELIVNRLATINYNKAKYEEQIQLLYNCLDYNNKTIQHNLKQNGGDLDPRSEYLLSRTTQIVRIVEGSFSDRISMAAQLQDIMNYPVAYIATNVMIEPPIRYSGPSTVEGKGSMNQLYKDICELYAIGMLAVRWLDDKDEDGNLLKPNAIAWLFTVTLATTVLPMRCRYASLDSTVLHHLNHITNYMQAYIDNTQKTSGLTAAIHHLQLLASDAGIDWSDVVARYAQTNLDHLANSNQQQEQEQEEEEAEYEVEAEMERMNIHPAAIMIEATAGKNKKKKKKVKFGSDKHRS